MQAGTQLIGTSAYDIYQLYLRTSNNLLSVVSALPVTFKLIIIRVGGSLPELAIMYSHL